jgi:hypothetical protein
MSGMGDSEMLEINKKNAHQCAEFLKLKIEHANELQLQ